MTAKSASARSDQSMPYSLMMTLKMSSTPMRTNAASATIPVGVEKPDRLNASLASAMASATGEDSSGSGLDGEVGSYVIASPPVRSGAEQRLAGYLRRSSRDPPEGPFLQSYS